MELMERRYINEMMRRVVENDDERALKAAIEALYPLIYTVAYKILENEEQAYDIMHDIEVMMGAMRTPQNDYVGYLLEETKRRALNIYAARYRNRIPDAAHALALSPPPTEDDAVIKNKTPAEEILSLMPDGIDKDMVILANFLGLTRRTIGLVVDMPKTTVDRRMRELYKCTLRKLRPEQLNEDAMRELYSPKTLIDPIVRLDPAVGKATHGRLKRLKQQKYFEKVPQKTGQSTFTQNPTPQKAKKTRKKRFVGRKGKVPQN